VEEIKTIEKLTGINLKHLYDVEIEDYICRDLDFCRVMSVSSSMQSIAL
jgi:hypothetical protein